MVFVRVRETYDLKTTKNKMTVIGIHTPKPNVIKKNYPGLLMQCKMYRPYSCDVKVACASMLPLDPQGVGTDVGDVAPEDIFNPILYKAMSNKGMSQLEARINYIRNTGTGLDVMGDTAMAEVDSTTNQADEFNLYYGLLANTHDWRHASPQAGLQMLGLKPLVYDIAYNIGDVSSGIYSTIAPTYAPKEDETRGLVNVSAIIGNSKPMPFINCLSYTGDSGASKAWSGISPPGFPSGAGNGGVPVNAELDVPYLPVIVAAIIVPPSKLHELFYRMVVEWTIEFSSLRPVSEITSLTDLATYGSSVHYQNYSYAKTKEAITGSSETVLENDSCMVSSNVDVQQVM